MLLLFTIIDHISYQTPATGADGFKLALIPSFRSHRACRRPLALQENSHSKIISVVRKTALRASWIGKKRLSLIRTGAGANFPALLRTVMCRSSFWGAGRRSEERKSANRPWIAMRTIGSQTPLLFPGIDTNVFVRVTRQVNRQVTSKLVVALIGYPATR